MDRFISELIIEQNYKKSKKNVINDFFLNFFCFIYKIVIKDQYQIKNKNIIFVIYLFEYLFNQTLCFFDNLKKNKKRCKSLIVQIYKIMTRHYLLYKKTLLIHNKQKKIKFR